MRRCMPLVTAAIAVFTLTAPLAGAQGGMLGRIKQKAAEEARRRAEKSGEKPSEKSADKPAATERGVGNAEPDETSAAAATQDTARARPGEGAWANYDFVPGEKLLRVVDFAGDVIGDFPRALEASEGNYEVVEWQGARWLRANGNRNKMFVPVGTPLPPRWTLEFDFVAEEGECWVYPGGNESGREPYFKFGARHTGGLVRGDGRQAGAEPADGEKKRGTPFTARVMVDGRYAKAYVNETRVVNIPNLDYTRGENVLFYCDGSDQQPVFVRNIRLAAGGRKLYDAIAESGRVATQGIYFDVASDRLRPESTPTLKEIGAMLTEHPDLRLVIEGHTDDTGTAAANKALSLQRAEAVRLYLIATHGIAADRLTAMGLGQEKPAVPNSSPEARQQNRRVELVQLK